MVSPSGQAIATRFGVQFRPSAPAAPTSDRPVLELAPDTAPAPAPAATPASHTEAPPTITILPGSSITPPPTPPAQHHIPWLLIGGLAVLGLGIYLVVSED